MIDRYATPEMRERWSDRARLRRWWRVELAAVRAWEARGDVPAGTADALDAAERAHPLDDAFVARVAEIERDTRHDVVAFTRALSERFGADARWIHMGLTSTDVVDTAQNLALVDAIDDVAADLAAVRAQLRTLADRHRDTLTIGRSHGVHAEPMPFGVKWLGFDAAAERDEGRLARAREAVGVAMLSGSVGTYAHVPPDVEAHAAAALDLTPDPLSTQVVARDRHAELLSALALVGTTIERIALEVRHLQRSDVREVREGFAPGQTGSSSMPHKKNPIASENLTGVARLLRGFVGPALEDVALWHERDISHSSVERVVLPDATTLASYALRRTATLLERLVVDAARMRANVDALHGLVYSQAALHALLRTGLTRERAYDLVQRAALRAWEGEGTLQDLLAADPDVTLTDAELAAAFDPAPYLAHVDALYARRGLPREGA
ncbi:MAG: adenylosuccinate lyase [Trueperaceae bacterium]|nr:adenylosuccinate lyase [Trueperaceae bacterium]